MPAQSMVFPRQEYWNELPFPTSGQIFILIKKFECIKTSLCIQIKLFFVASSFCFKVIKSFLIPMAE